MRIRYFALGIALSVVSVGVFMWWASKMDPEERPTMGRQPDGSTVEYIGEALRWRN